MHIIQIQDSLYINGKEFDCPKSLFFKNTVVQKTINNQDFYCVNGKEYIKGKWKYTIKSIWNTIF